MNVNDVESVASRQLRQPDDTSAPHVICSPKPVNLDAHSLKLRHESVAPVVDERDLDVVSALVEAHRQANDHALDAADIESLRDEQNPERILGRVRHRVAPWYFHRAS